jgi:hypothetical protein
MTVLFVNASINQNNVTVLNVTYKLAFKLLYYTQDYLTAKLKTFSQNSMQLFTVQ